MRDMKIDVIRLKPGADLYHSIQDWAIENDIEAATVLSGVGSLKQASLRFASKKSVKVSELPSEILQISGTVSKNGLHLHMTIGGAKGKVRGGHVRPGCRIRTTAEIVIGIIPETTFERVYDSETGYKELKVSKSGE